MKRGCKIVFLLMALGLALGLALVPLPLAAQAPSAPPAVTTPAAPAVTAPAAPAATPAPVVPTPVVASGHLPKDLSPWSMFMAADWLVKAVMLSLIFASFVTWTVWIAKSLELMIARRRLKAGLEAISNERTLIDARSRIGNAPGVLPALLEAAVLEQSLSADVADKGGIKERVASRLGRIEVAAVRAMNRGTGLLATIGSTAPFVGLFGTVWGIMNSFIGISKAQTTNLAVVAPGIAEALLATAIGLFAAIPAVIIYNQFARWLAGYKALVGDASAEVQRLVSRDLDREEQGYTMARAAE